jgi:hypothetical protein
MPYCAGCAALLAVTADATYTTGAELFVDGGLIDL